MALPTHPFERDRYWVEPWPPSGAALKRAPSPELAAEAARLDRRDDVSTWFYQPSWRRRDLAASSSTGASAVPRNWLLFGDDRWIADRLTRLLTAQGDRVIRVVSGDAYAHPEPELFHLPPAEAAGYRTLMRALRAEDRAPHRIVHLWNLVRPNAEYLTPERAAAAQDHAFYSLVYLAQALAEWQQPGRTQIDVLSSGVCEVVGNEPLSPARATLLGPCLVIPQAYAGLTCRCIDLTVPDSGADDALLAHAWAELQADVDQPVVAYRGGHRWVASAEPLPLSAPASPAPALRQRGVYLITGGTGGIGLVLAEYLASQVQARLVLIGRRRLPERECWQAWLAEHGPEERDSRRIRTLQSLEASGAEVLTLSADATDASQMLGVVASARARFGRIDGVIHAAGTRRTGDFADTTREMADAVLAPKMLGTLILKDALADESLDFLALCSSTSALLGGADVDDCAANAFLSAFSHAQARQGLATVAIDWGLWQAGGMAVDGEVSPHLERAKAAMLGTGILSAEGQDAFGRLLQARLPEVVVSPQDLIALLEQYRRLYVLEPERSVTEDAPASVDLAPAANGASMPGAHPRPHPDSAYLAPRTPL